MRDSPWPSIALGLSYLVILIPIGIVINAWGPLWRVIRQVISVTSILRPVALTQSDRSVRIVTQLGALACLAAAALMFWGVNPHCGAAHQPGCPGYAFGNHWVLRGERALAALAILTGVLTFVIRVVIIGVVPDQVGQTGIGWSQTPEAVAKVGKTTVDLQALVKTLEGEVEDAKRLAVQAAADTAAAVEDVENRLNARLSVLEDNPEPSE